MTPLLFFCTLSEKKIYYQLNLGKEYPTPLFLLGEKLTIVNIWGMNLDTIDPEQNIFHPTDEVDKILNLIGVKYSKSKSVVGSIVGCIEKEHIITLLKSEKCKSFRGYWKDVIPSF